MARDGADLIRQLTTPEYWQIARQAVPPQYDVPAEPDHPLFLQVDFGLVREPPGQIAPRLVEIQAFPSLYAYQPVLSQVYIDAYGLDPNLRYLLGGLDLAGYKALLGRAILGGHDPENVILMEIDPLHQKTLADFVLTERMFGVRAVCITQIRKDGTRLYYERDGRKIPIQRIYNRAIVDELQRRGIAPPSISATNWTSNGPAIPTTISASANSPSLTCGIPRCPRPGSSTSSITSRRTRTTTC
jgi:hypothetical protein